MKLNSRKGFSLIELMVAIGILSLGMAGVGSMLFQSFEVDRNNAKQRRAHIVSTQIAERLRGGNPPSKNPDGTGALLRLPPTSADYGNGIIIGSDLWWQDSAKTSGTYFCKWTTYSPSGAIVHDWDLEGLIPESGSLTHITVGWGYSGTGAGSCSRSTVETCPRNLKTIVILTRPATSK